MFLSAFLGIVGSKIISRLLVGAESEVQSDQDDGVPPICPLAVAAKARMAAKVFMIEMG